MTSAAETPRNVTARTKTNAAVYILCKLIAQQLPEMGVIRSGSQPHKMLSRIRAKPLECAKLSSRRLLRPKAAASCGTPKGASSVHNFDSHFQLHPPEIESPVIP